jgi:hypothetical protein
MRRDLPSGTVTFLFTDVEGSTKPTFCTSSALSNMRTHAPRKNEPESALESSLELAPMPA